MKFQGIVTNIVEKSGTNKKGEPYVAYQYRIEEETPSYPQALLGEVFGDRIPALKVGQLVEVDFNIRCDEYQGKFYGKNAIWKAEILKEAEPEVPGAYSEPPGSIAPNESFTNEAKEDDLPF